MLTQHWFEHIITMKFWSSMNRGGNAENWSTMKCARWYSVTDFPFRSSSLSGTGSTELVRTMNSANSEQSIIEKSSNRANRCEHCSVEPGQGSTDCLVRDRPVRIGLRFWKIVWSRSRQRCFSDPGQVRPRRQILVQMSDPGQMSGAPRSPKISDLMTRADTIGSSHSILACGSLFAMLLVGPLYNIKSEQLCALIPPTHQ